MEELERRRVAREAEFAALAEEVIPLLTHLCNRTVIPPV